MTKREMVDLIHRLNPTATSEFLARFDEPDLLAYLHQLQELERDRREHPEPLTASTA